MSSAPIVDRIRIIPRPDDFLDRNIGSSGEVFFNKETSSLRVFNGRDRSGFEIARADLANVSDSILEERISSLGITGGSGGASVDVSSSAPTNPTSGNLWLNTDTGRLYIYMNDGDSSQWIQPAVPSFSGDYNDLSSKPSLFSGDYNDLQNIPFIPSSIDDLTDVDTTTIPPTTGQVLKWNGTNWVPAIDIAEVGAGLNADTLGGELPSYYLNYTNLTNKPTTFNDLTLTGLTTLQQSTEVLVSIVGASGVVEHDFSNGAVFYHSGINSDFTANFTNIPETNNRTISTVLFLSQGSTARIPSALQIDGTLLTIKWAGGNTPSGNANKLDIVAFTLIRIQNGWSVIGSLSTYG